MFACDAMSIKYKDELHELTYSEFVTRLSYRYKYGKIDEIEEYNKDLVPFHNKLSHLDKLKFKYDTYKDSKKSWSKPLKLRNIFKDHKFVRDMYNCGKADINDHDGFGWYSEYFKGESVIP